MGVLCNISDKDDTSRFKDAVRVCEFVESHVLNDNGELLIDIPHSQRHRIQGLLYTHGNLSLIDDSGENLNIAVSLFLKALDLIMRSSDPAEQSYSHSSIDVILAVCVAGLLAGADPDTLTAPEITRALGISYPFKCHVELLNQNFNILQAVFHGGPRLIENLLRMGNGTLPMTFLFPEQASRLPFLLFPSYYGNLPGLVSSGSTSSHSHSFLDPSPARKMTATILLALARTFQSGSSGNQPSLVAKGVTIRGSTSLVLLFYYLAVAIDPSPAICNNMGIILSTVPLSAALKDGDSSSETVNGQVIAKAYYTKGLAQDSSHPHLLTNLGSLLKDQGKIEEAIRLFLI